MISQLERVTDVAQIVKEALKEEDSPSNCSLLAHRIISFEFSSIVPVVKKGLKKMHEFFKQSYKGVYCSICDSNTQFLVNPDEKTVVLSEKFCREITGNSLHMLLYFQVHFKKFMSLSNALLTLCDLEGNFIPEEAVPGAVQLAVKTETKNMLSDCRKYRNDPAWLEHCAGICEEFHLTRYSEFFQPDIQRYHKASLYLKTKLDLLEENGSEDAVEERMLLSMKARNIRKSRLLDLGEDAAEAELEAEAEEEQALAEGENRTLTIPELEQKFDDLAILKKREDADVRLDKLKVIYQQPGLELFSAGVATILTEEAVQKVHEAIALRNKLAKEGAEVLEETGSLWKAFVTGLLVMLFVFQ